MGSLSCRWQIHPLYRYASPYTIILPHTYKSIGKSLGKQVLDIDLSKGTSNQSTNNQVKYT